MPEEQRFRTILRGSLRLIGRFVRRRPWSFALAVTGATLFAAAIVASAYIIGRITDDLIIPVLDQGEPIAGRLVGAVAAVAGVALWKALAITLRRTAAGWLQFRTQADVRAALVDHQLRLEMAWYSRQSTGDLLAVSETDARQATFILAPLPFGTGATLLLIGSVALISALDVVVGLATLVAVTVIMSVNIRGSRLTFGAFEEVQRARGVVSSVAHESFDGALTVKALGREDFETGRLRDRSEALRDDLVRVGRIWTTYRVVVDALPAAATIAVLVLGAVRIDAGALTAGELVGIAYLLSLLGFPVRVIGFVVWDMAHSLAGWRRVEAVLEADELVRHGDITASRLPTGAEVTGEAVTFAYDTQDVLRGVELDIPRGRTVAVVGPTAAGKSTLAMLLARLWDPHTGRITLDGRDLRDFARAELSDEVAYVAQEAFLFDDTVRGNIALSRPVPDEVVEQAARLAGAHDFITDLPDGYDTRIGERGATLSGGQRQRVALARALASRPRLLVLDDATSAVDPSVEAEILRGLKSAELPSTVIVVAYRRPSIVLADEVVFVEDGRVAAHGHHADLMRTMPGYARLIEAYEEDAAARAAAHRPGASP